MSTREAKAKEAERAEVVNANIDLASEFLGAVFDNPAIAEEIPSGATVVVMPADDPKRAASNFDMAARLSESGKDVSLWTTDGNVLHYKTVTPTWPSHLGRVKPLLDYYRETDTLRVEFVGVFDPRRPWGEVELNRLVSLIMDTQTFEILGLMIPDFLSRVVRTAPHMLSWLTAARLHGISEEEVGELLRERRRPARRNVNAESLRRELTALTA